MTCIGDDLAWFWEPEEVRPWPQNILQEDWFLPLSTRKSEQALQLKKAIRLRGFQQSTSPTLGVFRSWGNTYVIPHQTIDSYWASRRGDFRRDVFRRRRQLPSATISESPKVTWEQLIEIHQQRWPLFNNTATRQRHTQKVHELLETGRAQVWHLSDYAYALVLVGDQWIFWQTPALNPQHAQTGAGKVLLSAIVDWGLAEGRSIFLGTGHDHDKNRWAESRTDLGDLYVGPWHFRLRHQLADNLNRSRIYRRLIDQIRSRS